MQLNEGREPNEFGQYDELRDNNIMNQFEEEPFVTKLPEKTETSAKEKLASFFLFVLVVFSVGWCLVSGMKGLWFANTHAMNEVFTNPIIGDVYEGEIKWVTKECFEYRHTINLIPAGTEHYYMMYSMEENKVILLRAPKGFDDTFTNDALNEISYQGRGLIRKLETDVKIEISDIRSAFEAEGVQMESALYVDIISNKLCMMQIFAGIGIVISSIYFYFSMKQKRKGIQDTALDNPVVVLCMTGLLLVSLCMFIYLMNMIGF